MTEFCYQQTIFITSNTTSCITFYYYYKYAQCRWYLFISNTSTSMRVLWFYWTWPKALCVCTVCVCDLMQHSVFVATHKVTFADVHDICVSGNVANHFIHLSSSIHLLMISRDIKNCRFSHIIMTIQCPIAHWLHFHSLHIHMRRLVYVTNDIINVHGIEKDSTYFFYCFSFWPSFIRSIIWAVRHCWCTISISYGVATTLTTNNHQQQTETRTILSYLYFRIFV